MNKPTEQQPNQVYKDSKEFLDYLIGLIPIDEIETVTDKLITLIKKHVEFSNDEIKQKHKGMVSDKLSQQTDIIIDFVHEFIEKQFEYVIHNMDILGIDKKETTNNE